MTPETCPMFGTECRHCSIETTLRPFTSIKMENNHFVPIKTGYKKIVLGAFCNDSGKWIEDMHYCPVIYSQSHYREPVQKWKIDPTGDTKRTQRIVHLGQKRLRA